MDILLDELAFDPPTQVFASQRLNFIQEQTTIWQSDDLRWKDWAQHPELYSELRGALDSDSMIWHQRLTTLGNALNLTHQAHHILVLQCLNWGWFDLPAGGGRHRPSIEAIDPQLAPLLAEHTTVSQRAAAFVTAGLCRDLHVATSVARSFLLTNVTHSLTQQTLSLLEACWRYGAVGLLVAHEYPAYTSLCTVKDVLIRYGSGLSHQMAATLLYDVWALHMACIRSYPHLWKSNLLVEPPQTESRKQYQARLFPKLRQQMLGLISDIRGCSLEDADRLYQLYAETGIAGLTDWRGQPTQLINEQRLQKALECVWVGVLDVKKEEIVVHLEALLDAAREIGLPLSIATLVRDRPSSPRRRALKRRLRSHDDYPSSSERALSLAYAQRVGIDERLARFRVRNILTYGILGFMERSTWSSILDRRLYDWLCLIKYGHAEGNLTWLDISDRALELCQQLGLPQYSRSLMQAIYNSIPKPRHWHGGKGMVTLNVHQRIPLNVTRRPRLNADWLVLPIPIKLALESGSEKSFVTLVADSETQLPIGCWLSLTIPSGREVCLALYQAIWHVGSIEFPIRGIPRTITLSSRSVDQESPDLDLAAYYLMTTIQRVPMVSLQGKRHLHQVVVTIQNWALNHDAVNAATHVTLLGELLEWLQNQYFPFHRQNRPPESIRRTGGALPGIDTPAAGWLLPRLGDIQPAQSTLRFCNYDYPIPHHLQQKLPLPYRSLPLIFPAQSASLINYPSIFVEVPTSHGVLLEYLQSE